jgi:hypothetical protein
VIRYRRGYKYILHSDYTVALPLTSPKSIATSEFILSENGVLTVIAGYPWDGPSGPTIDTDNFMRGSLIHDVLYEMMRQELLPQSFRDIADSILRDVCLQDGMSSIRAWWVYHGVRLGGGSASAIKQEEVIEAP